VRTATLYVKKEARRSVIAGIKKRFVLARSKQEEVPGVSVVPSHRLDSLSDDVL
jgi:hypothetical protein